MNLRILIFISMLGFQACEGDKTTSIRESQESYNEIKLQTKQLELSPISAAFEKRRNHIAFNSSFEIKNNSQNKYTHIEVYAFLLLVFNNDDTLFIPTPLFRESLEEMLDGLLRRPAVSSELSSISRNTPWLPSQKLSFRILIPRDDDDYSMVRDLNNNLFERTPDFATVVIQYKAIGVDDEINEIEQVDIADIWREYQEMLGLR